MEAQSRETYTREFTRDACARDTLVQKTALAYQGNLTVWRHKSSLISALPFRTSVITSALPLNVTVCELLECGPKNAGTTRVRPSQNVALRTAPDVRFKLLAAAEKLAMTEAVMFIVSRVKEVMNMQRMTVRRWGLAVGDKPHSSPVRFLEMAAMISSSKDMDLVPILELLIQFFCLDFALSHVAPGCCVDSDELLRSPAALEEARRGLPRVVYSVSCCRGLRACFICLLKRRPQTCETSLGTWYESSRRWSQAFLKEIGGSGSGNDDSRGLFSALKRFSDKSVAGIVGCNVTIACIVLKYFLTVGSVLSFHLLQDSE